MNKKFTKLIAAIALLVFMTPSLAGWGQTTHTIGWGTASGNAGTYTNFTDVSGQVSGVLSFATEKNSSSNAPAYNANASELRLYYASNGKGGSIIITPASGVTITDAVMTTSTTPSVNYFVDGGNAVNVTASNTSTYTISNISASNSLEIQNANTTNTQLRIKTIALTYTTGGPAPTTYTVTYHANVTGIADIVETYNEGATVTIADNTFSNPGNVFTEWNTEEDGSGDSYAPGDEIEGIDDDLDLYAQWEQSSSTTYTYNFAGANNFYTDAALTTHPSSGSGNNVETIYYGDGSVFVASGANRYFSSATSGYFLLGKTNAAITLPTFEGYRITQVKLHSSSGHSTSVSVSIVSGSNTASEAQTWLTKDHDYIYDIASDYQSSALSIKVTNNNNTQFTSITLVCEVDVPSPVATPTFSPAAGTYNAVQNVTISCETQGATIYYTIDGTAPTNASTQYSGAITVAETTTIKAIAYDGTDHSAVATATYTIELPLSTMDAIYAKALQVGGTATSVYIAFNNWVITAANTGHHAFLSDGTKGCMIYGENLGFTAGDVLSGTVQCNIQMYHGSVEITGLTSATTGLTVNTGGNVTVANIAMADLAGINTGALVSYESLICSVSTSGQYTNYNLSDGTTTIQAYTTLYDELASSLVDGKTYNITGIFVLDNSTKRINPRSAADIVEVISTDPYVTIESEEFELTANEEDGYLEITSGNLPEEYSFDIMYCDANGEELIDGPDWFTLAIEAPQDETGDFVYYIADANYGAARTAYFKVYASWLVEVDGDFEIERVYSNLVTVNQAQYVVDYATLPFVWAGGTKEELTALNGVTGYGLGTNYAESNAPYRVKFDNQGDYILVKTDSQPGVVTIGIKNFGSSIETIIAVQESSDGIDFTEVEELTITCAQNKTQEFETSNSFNVSSRYVRLYDKTHKSNFGVGPITIAKPATQNYTLTINGYGTGNDKWYLIAWPELADPEEIEGMISDHETGNDNSLRTYDLYYFDETGGNNGKEWKNYRQTEFYLDRDKGYLYASKNGVTFTFEENNDGFDDVILPYVENDPIQSLYLAGNSNTTAETFYVYAEVDEDLVKQTVNFLTINEDGNGFITTSTNAFEAQPLQGFFVESNGTNRLLSIDDVDAKSGNTEQLNIKVNRNRGTLVDNAIVSFSDVPLMNKFYLFDNTTRVYIPQNGEEMAVVRSEAQGEMPVNFRASENGTYTLSMDVENVEMNYLHLIDNMTGMDINLLQTPSYTFEANVNDYESRFRLVFAGNNEDGASTGSASFAFFSNGNWIINNAGEATLQVIDLMGHILSSESVNGSVSTTLNATPGVYMLRLINGENVKVQKIVVR